MSSHSPGFRGKRKTVESRDRDTLCLASSKRPRLSVILLDLRPKDSVRSKNGKKKSHRWMIREAKRNPNATVVDLSRRDLCFQDIISVCRETRHVQRILLRDITFHLESKMRTLREVTEICASLSEIDVTGCAKKTRQLLLGEMKNLEAEERYLNRMGVYLRDIADNRGLDSVFTPNFFCNASFIKNLVTSGKLFADTSCEGWSLLHTACLVGDLSLAKWLIDKDGRCEFERANPFASLEPLLCFEYHTGDIEECAKIFGFTFKELNKSNADTLLIWALGTPNPPRISGSRDFHSKKCDPVYRIKTLLKLIPFVNPLPLLEELLLNLEKGTAFCCNESKLAKVVALLLEKCKEMNALSGFEWVIIKYEMTMPCVTLALNHPQILKTLIKYGAKIDAVDENGETALYHISSKVTMGHQETVCRILLDAGASVHAKNRQGKTPLTSVIKGYFESEKWYGNIFNENVFFGIVVKLISAGADIRHLADSAGSIIHLAVQSFLEGSKNEMSLRIIKKLLALEMVQAKVPISCRDNQGDTVLHTWASRRCNSIDASKALLVNELGEFLITAGCSIDAANDDSCTALHIAVHQRLTSQVELLLKHNASVSALNKCGQTPLHTACSSYQNGSKEMISIIEMLIKEGSDLHVKDSKGNSSRDLLNGHRELRPVLQRPLPHSAKWQQKSQKHVDKLLEVCRHTNSRVIQSFYYHPEPIGTGGFGCVFAGLDLKDGREVAIKRIERLRLLPQFHREIENLVRLSESPRIMKYFTCVEDKDFLFIVLELMEGSLNELLDLRESELGTDALLTLSKDLVDGLHYLHGKSILHRDLKPNNLLYHFQDETPRLKIADFGLSKDTTSASQSSTVIGTNVGCKVWMAPEVSRAPSKHSQKSDVFSCGLVLHYIMSKGKHPFAKESQTQENARIWEISTASSIVNDIKSLHSSLGPEAKDIVIQALARDPEDRPSASNMIGHPVFWSEDKKLRYIAAFYNGYDKRDSVRRKIKRELGTVPRWDLKLTEQTKKMIKERKYDFFSCMELLRFIRNGYQHFLKELFGCKLLQSYPELLIELYNFIKRHDLQSNPYIEQVEKG